MTDFDAVSIAITTKTPIVDNKICLFQGDYDFLSNFHSSPIEFSTRIWPTVEHAYQAFKTTHFGEQEIIRLLDTPGKAKKVGKTVDLRKDWELIKVDLMHELCRIKFQEPTLQAQLILTDPLILIEGNWWKDTFWGICQGKGENMLGKILMNIRDEYKSLYTTN